MDVRQEGEIFYGSQMPVIRQKRNPRVRRYSIRGTTLVIRSQISGNILGKTPLP